MPSVWALSLADFDQSARLATLRMFFSDPVALCPGLTAEAITEQAAKRFVLLADRLRTTGGEPALNLNIVKADLSNQV
jgi:hypothetical protein